MTGNSGDNQTPQPVDELEEILNSFKRRIKLSVNSRYYSESEITNHAKARLLQWGTRQRVDELESITGFSKVGGVYTKAGVDTTKPNWQPISTQERKEKLQASLKNGGNDE